MKTIKAIAGLCALCALMASSFAVQTASATTKGTTAFTCKETGAGGGFTKAHCKAGDVGSGNFSHVAFAQGTTTEITVSNETTGGEKLASQVMMGFGDTVTGSAATVSGSGVLTNSIDASGEHYVHGEISLVYSEITENLQGCEVFEDTEKGEKGVVRTATLEFTSKGQGDAVKFFPKGGEVFASATVSNCVISGTVQWVGSMKCPMDGSTILCNKDEITTEKTLRVGSKSGPAAGFFGSITVKGRANSGQAYTPISPTTTETP